MKRKQDKPKMYVCRTTLMAKSLSEARRQFMKREPDEIWISEDWKEGKNQNFASAIGFDNGVREDED
jgi:hypothetical protein